MKAYAALAERVVGAIRKEDPDRLIIADGMQWGRDPVPELIPLGIAQSTRGYDPFHLTHYLASWAWNKGRWAEPTWPLKEKGKMVVPRVARRGPHSPLERDREERCRRACRRVGRVQQNAPQSGVGVDA